MNRNSTAVSVQDLTKSIKGQVLLSKINLECQTGKIYGIIGHNGSGKTMLFKVISGFVRPSEGSVTVFGKNHHLDSSFPSGLGILIETPGFLPHKSGYDNLKFLSQINRVIDVSQIRNVLTMVGLNPDEKKKVRNYSLGMRQRLGIAQAIMENPRLIILDEPMNALDEDGVRLVKEILMKKRQEGCTILLASHNKEDIFELCDEVFRMEQGKLKAVDLV
ncbi:ATP-binding cassette domain-containing protein [Paenibacillus sp. 2TAF8]|jgi:ABC-2 type transport system ATP-binding protein|uniref:ATP-binding cassette domain-containing protein n=1 Tax=Paenibacillus sp. 2TAF8 TaxID=3233020 RepID=UPI003F951F68